MNKGLRMATGEIVGCLNADDVYADDQVLCDVADAIQSQGLDAVYGDLLYVRRDDGEKVVRYWKAGPYLPGAFRVGWVPPHPTFFCRRELFARFGYYDPQYRIAGAVRSAAVGSAGAVGPAASGRGGSRLGRAIGLMLRGCSGRCKPYNPY